MTIRRPAAEARVQFTASGRYAFTWDFKMKFALSDRVPVQGRKPLGALGWLLMGILVSDCAGNAVAVENREDQLLEADFIARAANTAALKIILAQPPVSNYPAS